MKKQHGFTFIELTIAIAILGVLMTIAVPYYQSHVKKAKFEEVLKHVEALKQQVNICAAITHDLTQCVNGQNGVQSALGTVGSATPIPGMKYTAFVSVGAPEGYDHNGNTGASSPPTFDCSGDPVPNASSATPCMYTGYSTQLLINTYTAYAPSPATYYVPGGSQDAECSSVYAKLLATYTDPYYAPKELYPTVFTPGTYTPQWAGQCNYRSWSGVTGSLLSFVNSVQCPSGYGYSVLGGSYNPRGLTVDPASPDFCAPEGCGCYLTNSATALAAATPVPTPANVPTQNTISIFAGATGSSGSTSASGFNGQDIQLTGTMGNDYVPAWKAMAASSCWGDELCMKNYQIE